jgi:hypothetical protein
MQIKTRRKWRYLFINVNICTERSSHCVLIVSEYLIWQLALYDGNIYHQQHLLVYPGKKVKYKIHPRTGHESPQAGQSYSSTRSLTSTLNADWLSRSRLGRFTLGKETRYPFYRRLGEFQGCSRWMRKILPPPGFDSRTVQPVESHYTD